ncbi:T-cell immunoreceptor with Ig and ITIM domains-like isoform X2 [Paramormyrops kingsleyae]|uniref:T-cell immunoreceptor with Ig and ITIM domains-like isoform X2 n=1 Tax=Paramormyrops kingsleyae TaxID=1676925 RepID=UPI000CD63479|nr:T-cell immunoreceptor with Ig and ITIM domains-like isoform X2 [Paramormyrops kingsleyae]XP_023659473.1 T-cell immunoreceptor with Ig and ITIM domains-like isoform X2 [Paramormyrops kingsleyae]
MEFGVFSILLVMTSLAHYTAGNVPHIITDPHVNADLGGDFTLNCRLSVSNTNVIQVEWSWGSSEKPEEKIVVFKKGSEANYPSLKFSDRITFFSHSQHHVSIRISDVIMNDTGNYVCQYTTFPSGSFQATTTVTVTEPSHGASLWIVGTVMAALLFTVLLAAAVYVTLKHARKTTSARSRPDQTTNDQDKDLNYAEIGFFRKAGSTKVPQSKPDVEYGEVIFPSQVSSAHLPSGGPNADRDTTYAETKRA